MFLQVLEIKILLATQPWWADFKRICLYFFRGFCTLSVVFQQDCRKSKNSQNFVNYHH